MFYAKNKPPGIWQKLGRHLEQAMREAKGEEPPHGPQTPLRKEGEF